jgi:FixJ family two-component response regulator
MAKGLPAEKLVIFVVDDDPAVCSSLKFSLELEGFQVRTFANAAQVLKADNLQSSRCFIIDYKLPETNGLDLLAELRARDVDGPAILITSHPNRALRESASQAHTQIVEKPLLTDALIEEVRRVTRVGRGAKRLS